MKRSSFGQHGGGFLLAIRGERPAAQATREPLSYGRCRIANCDFNRLLTHETRDAMAVPVHQDSPLVSPS
jgi:hypothetical protein